MRFSIDMILNMLSIVCILLSMFVLDWIYLPENLMTALALLPMAIAEIFGSTTGLEQLSLTGWGLTSLTTIQDILRITLYMPLIVAGLAVAGVAVSMSNQPSVTVQQIGLAQIVIAAITLVALLFNAGRIRVFGLEPSLAGMAASLAGISLTIGYYAVLLGLALAAAAGFISMSNHTSAAGRKPYAKKTRPKYKR
ncbi:hypothetical protein HC928_05275 [bacterium]|nr:hypothetical protein [bacterium]